MTRHRRSGGTMVTWIAASLAVCALTHSPGVEAAGAKVAGAKVDRRTRARVLFIEAKQRYAEGKYRAAIVAFRAAGKLRASPLLDFNIARCHEQLGELAAATARYRRYLRARPGAPNAAEVRRRIVALRRRTADPYEDLERRPPVAATSAPTSGPASRPAASQPTVAATSRPATTPPRATGPSAAAPFPHEATLPGSRRARLGPPQSRPGPRGRWRAPPPRPRRPFYKRWQFWVGVGVTTAVAALVIGFAATQDEGSSSGTPSAATSPLRSGGLGLTF